MTTLSWIDLQFTGAAHVIATVVLCGDGELALVDPGPTPCLPTLEAGLRDLGFTLDDVTHILLTHIHLDHATSTGVIVRRNPRVKVLVHSRGATHMADPSKLIASATRLYGTQMDTLWGEFAPVPVSKITALEGGEHIAVAGRLLRVAYTPGHASHHVSYFDTSTGTAFVGDTAGVQIDNGCALPPTPPPDIDVEAWRSSAARILAWDPQTLFLTHFGPAPVSPAAHFEVLLDHLERMAEQARVLLNDATDDELRTRRFGEWVRAEICADMTDSEVATYKVGVWFEHLWPGLARYWRRREAPNL